MIRMWITYHIYTRVRSLYLDVSVQRSPFSVTRKKSHSPSSWGGKRHTINHRRIIELTDINHVVGGLEHFLFFHKLGIIISTDFHHIFHRG